MSTASSLHELLSPLAAVQRLLERLDNRGLIIGGVAASLLGKPRVTADLDLLILLSTQDLPRLLDAARQEGLVPRLGDALDFARRQRILLLRHESSGVNVDVALGALPFEVEAVERGCLRSVGELTLRLPTPEDLIILKAVAHRPKDLLDIEAVIASHPHLDRERIRRWVQDFSLTLEMFELWDDIAGWLYPA
jgi:hypothetical protein